MRHFSEFKEPLILDRDDWNSNEWKTIVGLFCGEDVDPDKIDSIFPNINSVVYFTSEENNKFRVTYILYESNDDGEWNEEPVCDCTFEPYVSVEEIKKTAMTTIAELLKIDNVSDGEIMVEAVIECNGDYYDSDEFVVIYNNGTVNVKVD